MPASFRARAVPAACLLVLSLGAGAVAGPLTNRISLNPNLGAAADDDCRFVEDISLQTLDLYLYDPVNPDFGTAGLERTVSNIGGFECRLEFSGGIVIVVWNFPQPASNFGTQFDLRVQYVEPLPVLGLPVLLATAMVIFDSNLGVDIPDSPVPECRDNANILAYVHPQTDGLVPGSVAYEDGDDFDQPWVPGSCAGVEPDFRFQLVRSLNVGVEPATWEGLKALYR